MADNGVVAAGGRLTDWVSLGVLAAFVPRDAVDDAVAAAGRQARRSDGKLPPHVMVYLVMALALPRSARWAGSGQLVPVTHIKIVRPGIHLVFEDAVWDSSRCEADDEHAPTGNLHPDGMRPLHSAAHPGTWDDVSVFYCLVYTAEDDLE